MKKFISLILIISLICTLGLTPVLAEDISFAGPDEEISLEGAGTFDVSYTIPTRKHKLTSNKITPNQGEIKVVFTENLASGWENITFKDSSNNSPKGGVYVTASGNTATVKFGELDLSTEYTLTIPATLTSTAGNTSVARSYVFNTIASKTLIDADFSDTQTWTTADTFSYTAPSAKKGSWWTSPGTPLGKHGHIYAFIQDKSRTLSMAVTEDKFLKVTSDANVKFFSLHLTSANRVSNANITTFMKFKTDAGNIYMGGLYENNFATPQNSHGVQTKAGIFDKNFVKNTDGLYDIKITSEIKENSFNSTANTVSFGYDTTIYDNLSSQSSSATNSATKTVTTANDYATSIQAIAIFRFGDARDAYIREIKSGFFTYPEILSEKPVWDGTAKSITYVMNTDIDVSNSKVKIINNETKAEVAEVTPTYDAATRKLVITCGEIEDEVEYAIDLTGVVSSDGIKCEAKEIFSTVSREVLGVTPANGAKIPATGEMTIVLSEAITEQELEDNVKLYKIGDENNPVGISFEVSTDGKTATVLYSNLSSSSEYVLDIGKGCVFGGEKLNYQTTGTNEIISITPNGDSIEVACIPGKVEIEFENPVTQKLAEESITFTNEGTPKPIIVTVSEEDSKVVSVILPKLEKGKTYLFKISDMLLIDEYIITYTVDPSSSDISVSPAVGETIDVNEREIEITFENEETLADIEESIVFVDEEGNAPKGGIYIRKDETEPKKAIVRFGRLEPDTEYCMTIGYPISVLPVNLYYKTGGNYLVDEDFDDWVTGEVSLSNPCEVKDGLLFGWDGIAANQEKFEIKENDGGNKYLSIIEQNKAISLGYRFDEAVTEGDFIIDMGINAGNIDNTVTTYVVDYSSAANPGADPTIQTAQIRALKDNNGFADDNTDANGFFNVTARLYKDKVAHTTGNWANMTDQTYVVEYTNPLGKYLRQEPNVKHKPVYSLKSVAFLKMDGKSGGDPYYINLDYVRAYVTSVLDAVNILDGYNPKERQLTIVFTDDVDSSSIQTLVLKATDHEVKATLDSYDANERTAIFNLSEHLNFGTDYEISVEDVKGTGEFKIYTKRPIKFSTMKKAIKINDKNVTTNTDTVFAVSIENTFDVDRDYHVAIVLYDDSGRAIAAKAEEDTLTAGDSTTVTITITGKTGASYKTFIWDKESYVDSAEFIPVE